MVRGLLKHIVRFLTTDVWNIKKLNRYIFFKLYRLHAHCDFVFFARFKKWEKYLLRNSRVLEIGPGGGPWTIELLLRGNTVTSVDLYSESLNRLRTKVETFPINNKKLKLVNSDIKHFITSERYDQIVLFEVLEHIEDDRLVIKKLIDFLSSDGQLLISTPSNDYIPYYGEELSEQRTGGHVRKGYSFEDYDLLFKDLGAEIVYRDSCAGFFTQKLNAFYRILINRFKINIIFNSILMFLLRWICYLDFLHPNYPNQVNFIIVKKKK